MQECLNCSAFQKWKESHEAATFIRCVQPKEAKFRVKASATIFHSLLANMQTKEICYLFVAEMVKEKRTNSLGKLAKDDISNDLRN